MQLDQNLLGVIKSILLEVKPEEIREMMERAMEICLTTDNQFFSQPAERYELMLTFKKIEHLIEAASSL